MNVSDLTQNANISLSLSSILVLKTDLPRKLITALRFLG